MNESSSLRLGPAAGRSLGALRDWAALFRIVASNPASAKKPYLRHGKLLS